MSGEDRPHRRPPRFAPTEHLASEAIAAYVDGELRMNAYLRAAHHISVCRECAAEVEAQQQARIALRQSSDQISAPLSLHDTLSRIPRALIQECGNHPADSFDSRRWTSWWRK
ncbi:hypothetical protein [Nocardia sp. CDC160]|uniref:hypothetical protein n=1 Tax=Nocardia sp. CDC160 TaxID=3112166 RepID=UPI002DB75A21|nr:hypothetical protein [Nocardia sp. CDC160]MEC3916699.1 hypothetical protein [Nocardia sp. CDC160]